MASFRSLPVAVDEGSKAGLRGMAQAYLNWPINSWALANIKDDKQAFPALIFRVFPNSSIRT